MMVNNRAMSKGLNPNDTHFFLKNACVNCRVQQGISPHMILEISLYTSLIPINHFKLQSFQIFKSDQESMKISVNIWYYNLRHVLWSSIRGRKHFRIFFLVTR